MDSINHNLLKEIAETSNVPCISLYLSTQPTSVDRAANQLLLKNLYKKTLNFIQENELREYESIIKQLGEMVEKNHLLEKNGGGLAIFASPENILTLHLPEQVAEISYVADHFCITPLLQFYQEKKPYYLLALGLDSVKLYDGDNYSIEELPIDKKIPKGMKEALGDELTDNHFHASVVIGAGLHGYMEKSQEEQIDTDRFFRAVDQSIQENFDFPPDKPLILAALPEHHNDFVRVSKNPNLSEITISINPESLSKDALLEKMKENLDMSYRKHIDTLLDRQSEAFSKNLGSVELSDVVHAVIDGKVEVLFVQKNVSIPGQVNINSREIEEISNLQNDVIHELARLVFLQGGHILLLDQKEVPYSDTSVFTLNRF